MFRIKSRIISLLTLIVSSFIITAHSQSTNGLGLVQTNVPWRAGHASAFQYPYVILYGGSQDTASSTNSYANGGSNELWAWDSRNGSWYKPSVQVQGGVSLLPQIYFKATSLPSQGQIIALVSNTTGGSATGVLQKLDINSWSWSFPSSNFQSSARTVGYSMLTVNNTIYTYGGLSVDVNGYATSNAVQNTLSLMDANNFQWSSGSNGLGLSDHTTCYLKACNCLVTFGGTSTGNPIDVTAAVNLYDLDKRVWNVQGIPTTAGASTPGARRLHTANCLDDIMIIYGGGTNQPADSDVWILNATTYPTLTWQKMNMANQSQGPNLRMGHSSVFDEANKRIYIYGGWGVTATNDSNMYVLDVNNWSWTRVATTGYPPDALPSTITDPINPSSNPLGTGAIVGAAVGGALGLIIIAAIAFFLIRRKRKQKQKEKETHLDMTQNDNPFYYNSDGYHNTNDDSDENDSNHRIGHVYYANNNGNQNKRMSKAFTGMTSTRNSLVRQSELGDSDKVITGILTSTDKGTVAATNGSRSPPESFRNSKVLLVTPTDYVGQGQVPNEIISQKPNEFSVPATRHNTNIPIQNLQIPSISDEGSSALQSASLDVLRSIKTNGSSMMNHTGNSQLGVSSNYRKRDGIPVTHATSDNYNDEEENWTFADSLSVNHPYTSENTPPIQYILPNSHQLSTATSTQTWDTKDAQQRQIPLVHHQQQQYPSSTLNMPMAQAVTPPITSNNSSSGNSSNTNESSTTNSHVNIYNAVSPLDVLVQLGQNTSNSATPSQHTPESSRHGSSTLMRDVLSSSGKGTAFNGSTSTTSSRTSETDQQKFAQLAPLISALPRRYLVDKSKAPITGPANNILFATSTNNDRVVAVKSFGRREAWERECRNLIKLKSPCVVEILEVLTIQCDQSISTPHPDHDEDDIQYVTVMERLDETLNSYIRRSNKRNTGNGLIARDILQCLSWCHSNGIAFCDLKPSNIMHHEGEHWKLIDFEASRTIDEECVGVITPRYCPPEVARATTYGLEGANGVVATASVDLWSLGCVIYELETRKALFPSNVKDETILHFVSHPSPSTPILNNGLRWNENKELEIPQFEKLIPKPHIRQLIKILLSRDPNRRGSASQLLEDPYFST